MGRSDPLAELAVEGRQSRRTSWEQRERMPEGGKDAARVSGGYGDRPSKCP